MKVFIALTDLSLELQIEEGLSIEDEMDFLRMLEKLQYRAPIFKLTGERILQRIHIDIRNDQQ